MKYTITDISYRYEFVDDKKKKHSYKGYAFMDESNHCMIIVYGENKRDLMIEYLLENSDEK